MNITLCLDFGNTRLKAAVFHHDQLQLQWVLPDGEPATIQAVIEQYRPDKSILSSVVNHHPEIESLLASNTQFHLLSHLTKVNFNSPVGKPETIGADRLALVAAAVHFFPGKNNLIVCLGSCITYNFVNQYHQFLGGAISPGMDMRYRSMHQFTAKLPMVEPDDVALRGNFPIIGYDTKTNLQSGVIAGITYEIEGFLTEYQHRYGNFNAVLTGGSTPHFARRLKNKIFADSNFLFKGLYAISETNNC
ncbi:MAG: hypothetical protein RLY16_1568 [Bacteroidota bacterium]